MAQYPHVNRSVRASLRKRATSYNSSESPETATSPIDDDTLIWPSTPSLAEATSTDAESVGLEALEEFFCGVEAMLNP